MCGVWLWGLDRGGAWSSWEERDLPDLNDSGWGSSGQQSEGPQDCASRLDTAQMCGKPEAWPECFPRDPAGGVASAAALLPVSKSGHPGRRLPGPQMLWDLGKFLRNEMVHRLPGTTPRAQGAWKGVKRL